MTQLIDRVTHAVHEFDLDAANPRYEDELAKAGRAMIDAVGVSAAVDRLRAEHFAQAHTDMVGDAEYRAGYLAGIEALAAALK